MKKPTLATTFTAAEVDAMDKLMQVLREGRFLRAREIAISPAITNAHRKFLLLREKAKGGAS